VGGVIRKRFDTRFFLAPVPQGQVARHDDHETTESVWLARLATYTSRDDGSPESLMPLSGEATATPTGSWPTGIVARTCCVTASSAVSELPFALATNNE